jgi:hypothetical protein
MKRLFNQALWVLTGGHLPIIHIPDFRTRHEKLHILHIPKTSPPIEKYNLEIPISTNKLESSIVTHRMAIGGIRPVSTLVPFHLTLVPVMGLTIPGMKAATRLIRLTPRLIIKAINMEIPLIQGVLNLIKRRTKAHVNSAWRFSIATIPALILPHKTKVIEMNAQNIPGYFIRINPTPFGTMERSKLIRRRSIIADALNIPGYKIELVRIFQNVDLFQGSRIEFDNRNRTLKVFPQRISGILSERYDIVVGRDRRTDEIHIAKYEKI